MRRNILFVLPVLCLILPAISSCSSKPKKNGPILECPAVFIPEELSVQRRPDAEIHLTKYEGTCAFDASHNQIKLYVTTSFSINKSHPDRPVSFSYFVAVPSLYPSKDGKILYTVSTIDPAFRDDERTPVFSYKVPEEGTVKPVPEVYIGLQIDPKDLMDAPPSLAPKSGPKTPSSPAKTAPAPTSTPTVKDLLLE